MTDPSRIRALISRIEAGHVGRKESDEYLVLCCGWERNFDFGDPPITYWDDRPHPLANAQDAPDSLPENVRTETAHQKYDGEWFWMIRNLNQSDVWSGEADTIAAAICLARLNMELAKESG